MLQQGGVLWYKSHFFSSSFKRIGPLTWQLAMLCVMGEDKEAQQQVALKAQRRVCWGKGYLRPKIYIRLCRVPYTWDMGLAYCFFDKICVSALHHAPINHIAQSRLHHGMVVITPLLKVA